MDPSLREGVSLVIKMVQPPEIFGIHYPVMSVLETNCMYGEYLICKTIAAPAQPQKNSRYDNQRPNLNYCISKS